MTINISLSAILGALIGWLAGTVVWRKWLAVLSLVLAAGCGNCVDTKHNDGRVTRECCIVHVTLEKKP